MDIYYYYIISKRYLARAIARIQPLQIQARLVVELVFLFTRILKCIIINHFFENMKFDKDLHRTQEVEK